MRFCALIFVLIVATSCGTTRHSVTQETAAASTAIATSTDSTTVRKQVNALLQESLKTDIDLQTIDEMEIIREEFTLPDSLGQTHLQVRTITRYKGSTQTVQSTTYDGHSTSMEQIDSDRMVSWQETAASNAQTTVEEHGSRKSDAGIVGVAVIVVTILIISLIMRKKT